MRTLLVALVFALARSTAQADTFARSDFKDSKKYGNCNVITGVDMFTDEETPLHSSAEWDGKSGDAYIHDDQLARWLLDGLARGQRVAIQVGDKKSHCGLPPTRRTPGIPSVTTSEYPANRLSLRRTFNRFFSSGKPEVDLSAEIIGKWGRFLSSRQHY